MDEIPWTYLMWAIAAVVALRSLVQLSIARRDELRGKLNNYLKEELTTEAHRRRILAAHRRHRSKNKE